MEVPANLYFFYISDTSMNSVQIAPDVIGDVNRVLTSTVLLKLTKHVIKPTGRER